MLLNSLPVFQLENEERDRIQKIKDEECVRATAELDFWRETQRKTAEEKENRQKLQGAGKRDNKPVYQKTERANVTPAITPLHNTSSTTSGTQAFILRSRADLMFTVLHEVRLFISESRSQNIFAIFPC